MSVALLLLCVPANAAATIYFIAINDTLPYDLSDSTMPFFEDYTLYIPYTVFNQESLNIFVAYSSNNQILTLYTLTQRLTYYISGGYSVDENDVQYEEKAVIKNGLVFVPAFKSCEHFGLTCNYLYKELDWPIFRIKNGNEVYGDTLFGQRAASVMSAKVEKYERGTTAAPEQSGTTTVKPSSPSGTDPIETSAEPSEEAKQPVSLVFTGGDYNHAVTLLNSYGLKGAFFFSSDQLLVNADMIRELFATGHSIGLYYTDTVELSEGNRLLDEIIMTRTRLVLQKDGAGEPPEGYVCLQGCVEAYSSSDAIALADDAQTPLPIIVSELSDSSLADVLKHILSEKFSYIAINEVTAADF